MEEWENPMYQFRDTTKRPAYKSWIPTSAMIYGGTMIEKIIPVLTRVGDKIELIGQIVSVKQRRTRRSGRPYMFINFGTSHNSVKVTNGRQIISISNAALKKGDRVEMLIREGKILINGENKTRVLDLTSPFKSFTVRTGEVIKSDNGTPLIKYRGVWL